MQNESDQSQQLTEREVEMSQRPLKYEDGTTTMLVQNVASDQTAANQESDKLIRADSRPSQPLLSQKTVRIGSEEVQQNQAVSRARKSIGRNEEFNFLDHLDPTGTRIQCDPLQGLSQLERVTSNFEIQNSQITPFDRFRYVQVMKNPLAGTDSIGEDEIITVQMCKPILEFKSPTETGSQFHREEDFYTYCDKSKENKKCFLKFRSAQRKNGKNTLEELTCFYCEKKVDQEMDFFQCDPHKFTVCSNCNLKHYLRKKVQARTEEHFHYERYVLQAVTDIEQEIENAELDQKLEKKRQTDIETQAALTEAPIVGNVTSSVFGELVLEEDKPIEKRKHAIIGFWKKNRNNQTHFCYRMIRVEQPLTLTPENEGCVNQLLLHVSEKNELFYFTKKVINDDELISLNILDNQACVSGQNLIPITTNIDKPPILESILVTDSDSSYLLSVFFNRISKENRNFNHKKNGKELTPCLALPKLIYRNNEKYLVVVEQIARKKVTVQSRFEGMAVKPVVLSQDYSLSRNWFKTSYRNIFFLSMSQEKQNIDFVVYDSNLFLKLNKINSMEIVWVLKNNSIAQYCWGQPIKPGNYTQALQECSIEISKDHDLSKNSDTPPYQDMRKQYMLSPAEGSLNFEQQSDELHLKIHKFMDKRLLVDGTLHFNDKRVSIIFVNGGIFSFQLNEAVPFSEEGSWYGQISHTKGIRLDKLKWHIDQTITGEWKHENTRTTHDKVIGNVDPEGCTWTGFIEQDGVQKYLEFEEFNLKTVGQLVKGSGKHNVNQENDIKYQVDGKFDSQSLKIKFNESYTDLTTRHQVTIFYQGELNEYRSVIEGHWGTDELTSDGGRFMLQIQCDDKLKMNLDLLKGENIIEYRLNGQLCLREVKFTNFSSKKTKKPFTFLAIKQRSRASTWLKNLTLDDAQFCTTQIGSDTRLLVAGNLRECAREDQTCPNGYNRWNMDVIDLDQDINKQRSHSRFELGGKLKKQLSMIEKIRERELLIEQATTIQLLEFVLPTFFHQITDDAGNLKLPPHNIMPLTIKATLNEKSHNLEIIDNRFSGQLFFSDPLTKMTQLIYLEGQKSQQPNQDGSFNLNLPKWPSSQSEDVHIQYPILAYKTQLPTNNEICLVNLIKNEPQKIINLEPFTFVQFIDVGLNPERFLVQSDVERNVNTCVFFLVELNGVYRVMYYKIFPFDLGDQNDQICFQTDDCFKILSGSLHLESLDSKGIDLQRFTNEKIISASFLQRPQVEGVQMIVVIQLIDGLFYFSLNNKDTFGELSNTTQLQMIRLIMQRGPFEEIYYGERTEQTGDQIICLQYKTAEKIQSRVVKKMNGAKLLAMQMQPQENFDYENYKQHSLIVIDSNSQYTQYEFDDANQDPKKSFQKCLKQAQRIDQIMNYFDTNPWARIVGSTRNLTVLLDEKMKYQCLSLPITISMNSQLVKSQKIYKFQNDVKFEKKMRNLPMKVGEDRHMNSVRGVAWMNKTLFEVQDTRFDYFMLKGKVSSKKIQLIMPDQLQRLVGRKEIIFIANMFIAIPVETAEKYLLFSQHDFKFVQAINYKSLKRCGPIQNGIQYFVGVQSNNVDETFLKFMEDGAGLKPLANINYLQRAALSQVQQMLTENGYKRTLSDANIFKGFQQAEGKVVFVINLKALRKIDEDLISKSTVQVRKNISKTLGIVSNIGHNFDGDIEIFEGEDKHSLTGIRIGVNIYAIDFNVDEKMSKYTSLYAIEAPHIESSEDVQLLYTESFLVIISGTIVLYHSIKDKKYRDHINFGKFEKRLKGNKDLEPLQFKLINIKEFFSQQNIKFGLKVRIVTPGDANILDKIEHRPDMIQISFSNLAIVWDLNENKEVSFVENQKQFATSDTFVNCGLVPHINRYNKDMKNSRFLSTNEEGSLIIQPSLTVLSLQTLFRQYCELDLIEMAFIQRCGEEDRFVKQIDFQTMLANFEGLTFFEIFQDRPELFELIFTQIREQELRHKKYIDVSGNESDNIIIRLMFWTMLLPLVKQNEDIDELKRIEKLNKSTGQKFKNMKNILIEKLTDPEGQFMLDSLLALVMLSEEKRLSNLVCSFSSFKKVFQTKSKTISDFMENSLFFNEQTVDVKSLKWNHNDSIISFGQQTSQLSPAMIQREVEQVQKKKASTFKKIKAFVVMAYSYITDRNIEMSLQKRDQQLLSANQMVPVKVEILEIEWLSDSMKDLYVYMSKLEDNSLFGNEFIKILLDQQSYTKQIVLKVFIPYCFYLGISLYYMSFYVPVTICDGFTCLDNSGEVAGTWLRSLMMALGSMFLIIEFMQIYILKWSYFEDQWNYLYIGSILINMYVVLEHSMQLTGLNYDQLNGVNSVAVVVQWSVMYYWMRLFPQLAFFVTFLVEVMKDIGPFLTMFIICILMFGNAIYVLNMSQLDSRHNHGDDAEVVHDETPIVTASFGNVYLDAMLDQYQIAIGMAELDAYGTEQPLIWVFYLCTTLWTQLTFFNMLIGIMGQTFERVVEGQERNSLMERTKMYADFMWVIRLSKLLKGKRYMYIVRPIDHDENEQIEGSISGVRRTISRLEKKIENQLKAQSSKICTDVADFQISSLNSLNDKINTVQDDVKNLGEKMEKLVKLLHKE